MRKIIELMTFNLCCFLEIKLQFQFAIINYGLEDMENVAAEHTVNGPETHVNIGFVDMRKIHQHGSVFLNYQGPHLIINYGLEDMENVAAEHTVNGPETHVNIGFVDMRKIHQHGSVF